MIGSTAPHPQRLRTRAALRPLAIRLRGMTRGLPCSGVIRFASQSTEKVAGLKCGGTAICAPIVSDSAMFLAAASAGFAASAGLIVAIGAQNAFVLRQGLLRQHVGLVVAVCMFGDIALIVCGVGGIGVLVHEWPALLQVLRFGGAAFIGAYGLTAAHRAWRGSGALSPTATGEANWRRALLACMAFTFLNPHVYLDTMVLLGSLSTRYSGPMRWAFAVGACSASVLWFAMLGYGARLLLPVFRNPRAWRALDAMMAVFMFTLCLLLLLRPIE